MGAIVGSGEVYHTVDTGKGCATTAATVRVELLFGQNIAAILEGYLMLDVVLETRHGECQVTPEECCRWYGGDLGKQLLLRWSSGVGCGSVIKRLMVKTSDGGGGSGDCSAPTGTGS